MTAFCSGYRAILRFQRRPLRHIQRDGLSCTPVLSRTLHVESFPACCAQTRLQGRMMKEAGKKIIVHEC
jgi:hypothetical protein